MAEAESALSDFEDDELEATPVVLPSTQSDDDRLRKEVEEVRRQKEEAEQAKMELRRSLEARDAAVKERDEALKQVELLSKQKEEAFRAREQSRSEIESAARLLVLGAEKITSLVGDSKLFSGGLPRSTKYTGLAAISHGFCKKAEEIIEVILKQRDEASKNRSELQNQMEQRNYQIAIEVSQLEAAVANSKEELEKKTAEWQKVAEKHRSVQQNLQEKLVKAVTEAGSLKTRLETMELNAGSVQSEHEKLKDMLVAHFKGYLATEEAFVNFLHKVDGKAVKQVAALPFSDFVDLDKVHQEYLRRVNSISDTLVHMENSWAEKEESRQQEKLQLERSIKVLKEKETDAVELLKGTLDNRKEVSKVDDDIVGLAAALDVDVRNSRLKLLELERKLEGARMEIDKLTKLSLLQAKDMAEKAARIHELEEKDGIATTNVEGLSAEIAAAEEELARWKEAAKQEAAAGVAILEEVESCNREIASLNQLVIQLKQSLEEANNKLQSKEEMAAAAMAARDAADRSLRVADERAAELRERLEDMSRQLEDAEAQMESSRICGSTFLEIFPWFRDKLLNHRARLREATTHASAEMEELLEPLT